MTTPTQQILQTGTYANDGTGDTLRDAGRKINDNFTYLWTEVWDGEGFAPGRKFTCKSISGALPDSGEFTILNTDLDTVKISRYDVRDKSFKTSTSNSQSVSLSLWSLDSGTADDWNLMGRYQGSTQYVAADDYWLFTKTSDTFATSDTVDSGGTYYIKIDGVW